MREARVAAAVRRASWMGFVVAIAGALISQGALAAGPSIREVQVQFKKGESSTTLKGTLKGDETVDYKLRASAGQAMVVNFKPTRLSPK